MSFRDPEGGVIDLDGDLGVQFGVYYKDIDQVQGGFETLEDAEEHAHDLVEHGTIYPYEYKIVKINYEIEEVV